MRRAGSRTKVQRSGLVMQQVIGLLDRPVWAVFAATALLLIAFHELGYRRAQGSKALSERPIAPPGVSA